MSKDKKVDGKIFQMNQSYSQLKQQQKEIINQHIFEMEAILDKANSKIYALEAQIKDFEEFQTEIKKLEDYYTSPQWKDDFEMDEKGELPENLKRGVLSEDGIYNMLERNKELLDRISEAEDKSISMPFASGRTS